MASDAALQGEAGLSGYRQGTMALTPDEVGLLSAYVRRRGLRFRLTVVAALMWLAERVWGSAGRVTFNLTFESDPPR